MIDVNLDLQTVLQWGGISFAVTGAVALAFKPDLVACTFGLGGVRCTFRKEVRDAGETLADAGVPAYRPEAEPQGLAGRELVRRALDGLGSALRDGFAVLSPGGGPAVGFTEAVETLSAEGHISPTQKRLIDWLYNAGDGLLEGSKRSPFKADALSYWRLAQALTHWLRLTVIPEIERSRRQASAPSPPPRQPTRVGGYGVFPAPTPERPAAILSAVSGPLAGKSFLVDRPLFHIGAGPENDLVVAADEYLSGQHAYLRHQSNNLFLFDADSRNGTWLNGHRVSKTAETLAIGDHIRVGQSTFRVAPAAS